MGRNICFFLTAMLTAPSLLTAQTTPEESTNSTPATMPFLYYEYDNRGPSKWGEIDSSFATCSTGKKQSPIEFGLGVTVNTALRPLEFHYNTVAPADYIIVNRQETIQLEFTTSPGYIIDPNDNRQRYNVLQVHFHSPSEHGIAGGRYPLEMHIVHTAEDEGNEHQLAVVGVFFEYGMNNEQLNAAWRSLPTSPLQNFENYLNRSAEFVFNITKSEESWEMAVPGSAFYTYTGSLTAPPCTEGVKWFVMHETTSVSTAQVAAFRSALFVDEEKAYAESLGVVLPAFTDYGDHRPFMPVNGRSVQLFPGVAVSDDDEHVARMAAAALAIASVTILGFFVVVWTVLSRYLNAPKDSSNFAQRRFGTDSYRTP